MRPPASLPSVVASVGLRRSMSVARKRLNDVALDEHPWYAADDVCADDAVFIGGCGRSGTTLVREVLSRHPAIACGPESHILSGFVHPRRLAEAWRLPHASVMEMVAQSRSVVRFAEAFFRSYAQRQGKARWADKSPGNVRYLPRILSRFPKARFIHVVRDGRDVACSLRNHPRQKIVDGVVVPQDTSLPIDACAKRWLTDTSAGLAFKDHPRCYELRYEAFTADPARECRRLCTFLGEEFHPAMLECSADPARDREPGRWLNNENAREAVAASRAGRWRRDLSLDERRVVSRLAGELLVSLGYAKDQGWVGE
jgi:protein-tyrosine sulfotransferase